MVETGSFAKLLTDEEAADLLGVSPVTLAVWRCRRRYDLPFVRVGRRIRYRMADVVSFVERRTVRPDLSPAA